VARPSLEEVRVAGCEDTALAVVDQELARHDDYRLVLARMRVPRAAGSRLELAAEDRGAFRRRDNPDPRRAELEDLAQARDSRAGRSIAFVRHAILGAGGVGGFMGGALAHVGADVTLILRAETLARFPPRLSVESAVLGDFEVEVRRAGMLDGEVDVIWVTPKAPHLTAALALAPPEVVGDAVVLPLMNGVDHVALLRSRYERVLAGAIIVESERAEPGVVLQKSPFASVALAPGPRRDEISAEVEAAGIDVRLAPDEETLLWEKLVYLAPLALTTTALGAPAGAVQADPEWQLRLITCHDEAVSVALAEGATLDAEGMRSTFLGFQGGDFRTSMQKDFDAARPLELDAIAGPIVRGGQQNGVATPVTEELVGLVEARLAALRA
jgi:2-dehydropantoate 2-reductase